MGYKMENPRRETYTFYLSAKDGNGNYSDPTEINIQHAGIQQLPQPEVDRFFEAFVVHLPTPMTKFSTQQVLPKNNNVGGKDVLGYVLRLSRIDDAGEGESSYIEKKIPSGRDTAMVEVPTKSEWDLSLGAYDSVVHPDHNPDSFEATFSDPLAVSARQLDDITDFADELRPLETVNSLPTLPDDKYPNGIKIYNWSDKKIYRQDNGSWVQAVKAELDGQITETQISDGAISTPKLQVNSISSDKIQANAVTAGQIEAGAISADEIASNAIISEKIASGEIFANHIQVDDLQAISGNFSGELTATDTRIYEGDYGGVLEFFNGSNKLIEIGNTRSILNESSSDAGIVKIYDVWEDAKVGMFVTPAKQGILALGHENSPSGDSISSLDSSYLIGGRNDRGAEFILRDQNLDMGVTMGADEDSNSLQIHNPDGSDIILSATNQSSVSCELVEADEITATTKNFSIKHPDPEKEEYKLYHSAVETNTEGDNLYRYSIEYKSDEEITIDLPLYFKYLNKKPQVFVTPQGHFGTGYGNVDDNKLTINCNENGEYNVLVIATRKDKNAIENWKGAERHYKDDVLDNAYARNKKYDRLREDPTKERSDK
jgi:hypothetical protein